MEIVYLNLSARPQRNERFLQLNAGVADFRRIDAVPGTTLQTEELIRGRVIAEPLTAFTTGARQRSDPHDALGAMLRVRRHAHGGRG